MRPRGVLRRSVDVGGSRRTLGVRSRGVGRRLGIRLEPGEWSGLGTEDFSTVETPGRSGRWLGCPGGELGWVETVFGTKERLRGKGHRRIASVGGCSEQGWSRLRGRVSRNAIEDQGRAPGQESGIAVGGSNPPSRCLSVDFKRVREAPLLRVELPPDRIGWDGTRAWRSGRPGGLFFLHWEWVSWTGSPPVIGAGSGLRDLPARREGCRLWDVGAPADGPAGWLRHHPAGSLRLSFDLGLLQGSTRRKCWGGAAVGHICPSWRLRRVCIGAGRLVSRGLAGGIPRVRPPGSFFRVRVARAVQAVLQSVVWPAPCDGPGNWEASRSGWQGGSS